MAAFPSALSIFLSIAVLSLCTSAQSDDVPNAKVWAVVAYINHGEKTPTLGGLNTVLTPMGARQMWRQGSAFRNRYLGTENSTLFSNSTGNYTIQGISKDAINNADLTVLSQTDEWVAGGAVAFMQGLYPATTDAFNSLAGGQVMAQDVLSSTGPIDYPLGGYQYPSIETMSMSDSGSVAIQGTVGCWAWDTNVNLMKQTDPFGRARSTQSLYRSLFATPPLQGTISNGSVNYWNAYNIYEYVNYMNTHNKSVNSGLGFANTTVGVLKENAFELERAMNGDTLSAAPNWTYNNITTIAGQTLGMQIASSLSGATLGSSGSKLTLMFGSFEPMLAFFSLMGLYSTDNLLSGPFSTLPDPGSAMIIELIGQDSGTPPPYRRLRNSCERSDSPGGFKGTGKMASDVDVTVTKRGREHERSLFSRYGKKPVKRRGFRSKEPFMEKPLSHRPKQSLSIPEERRYVYKPLGENNRGPRIREPRSGGHCTASPYEAISYVWGTSDRRFELVCDGAVLPLTQSIRDALMRVRLPDRPRRLWADQICINQDDIAERSQQVKLMNAVYKNASKVLVWLGRDLDGVAADAVRMVHHLDGVFKDDEAHEKFKVDHEENLPMQSSERWVPLAKLTKLPWFHRIWIVQEIGTTAPATLYWGDTEMDWDMLSFVAGILNERYHHLRSRFFIGTSNIRYLHKRFVEPDVEYDQFHNRGNFAYELHRARHLLAQDPRDHVYAFLGHFSIGKGSEELQGLEADYSKSIGEVFFDVAVRGLRGADDLVMLAATHHSRSDGKRRAPGNDQDLDLPSWVPDWRDLPMHILGSPAVPHRASKDTKPDLTIDEDARILHARGVRVDVVERHSWTIYGTAFQVRHDDQKQKKKWWRYRQHQQGNGQASGNDSPQSHEAAPLINDETAKATNTALARIPWKSSGSKSAATKPLPSHAYTPFLKDAATSPSPSPSTPTASQDHHKSAFFALIQTLTNACTGMDRTRAYSSISPDEWLASGAAYLVRYALPASASTSLSPSQTFPSFLSQRSDSSNNTTGNGNLMSNVFERANSLSVSSHTPISPAIHALSLTGDPFKWSHEATLITRYRRFAVTRNGYFVLGPDALQEGDVVAVLRGGKTPFLLREVTDDDGGSSWILVGECYVHGLMNGEGWDVEGCRRRS
ncbi:hypothetical protein TrVFT333_009726 [Trichoderma virens FT-333]|nr:hypothetical protein TrVFT333_009726 [Trichoderma virens FT-333]